MSLINQITGILGLGGKRKPISHKLKWKLPEGRYSSPLENADAIVNILERKLHAKFIGGGEYSERVFAKEFGEGVFAYMLVRTDKRTEEETIVADAYMIQEEDERLGFDVSSGFKIAQDLESMGYDEMFTREYKAWKFNYFEVTVSVLDIASLGGFIEVAAPATNFAEARERMEKRAMDLFAKLSIKKEDVIPTDVITIELMESAKQSAPSPKKGSGEKNMP